MRYITAVLAAFGLLLLGTALPATATGGEPTVDYCDHTQKPSGSIKAWLEASGQVPSGCVDFTVTVECGQITVDLTNKTSLAYEVRALVNSLPSYTGGEGTNIFPVTFEEDDFDGSVDVSLWVEGAEADYLTGSGVPNFWDANAATHTVVTDCEEPVDEEPVAEDPTDEDPKDDDTDPVAVPTEIPAGESLPKTGVSPVLIGLAGAGLLGAGGGLLALQRRRMTS